MASARREARSARLHRRADLLPAAAQARHRRSRRRDARRHRRSQRHSRRSARRQRGAIWAHDEWWAAVGETRQANDDHMGEEEREGLSDFRRHAPLGLREALGRQYREYMAEHPTTKGHTDRRPRSATLRGRTSKTPRKPAKRTDYSRAYRQPERRNDPRSADVDADYCASSACKAADGGRICRIWWTGNPSVNEGIPGRSPT